MSQYLSEITPVKGKVAIWAIPKTDAPADEEAFHYQLFSQGYSPWQDGAVKVHEEEITIVVPEGINLVEAAVKTLRAAQDRIRAESVEQIEQLESRIKELALITYQPEIKVVPGYDGEPDVEVV